MLGDDNNLHFPKRKEQSMKRKMRLCLSPRPFFAIFSPFRSKQRYGPADLSNPLYGRSYIWKLPDSWIEDDNKDSLSLGASMIVSSLTFPINSQERHQSSRDIDRSRRVSHGVVHQSWRSLWTSSQETPKRKKEKMSNKISFHILTFWFARQTRDESKGERKVKSGDHSFMIQSMLWPLL